MYETRRHAMLRGGSSILCTLVWAALGWLPGLACAADPAKTVKTSLGAELNLIPAGTFEMGSPDTEIGGKGRHHEEEQQHKVQITKPFYLGKFAVTQAEYQRVQGSNLSAFSATGKIQFYRELVAKLDTKQFPVDSVSWYDAIEFCNKLSSLEKRPPYYQLENVQRVEGLIDTATVKLLGGSGYRLPTEAEWEYACRAGTVTAFHFGDTLDSVQANINGEKPSGTSKPGRYLRRPTKVGSYRPNAFGLYDMHGNISQWCQDWRGEDYYAKSPTADPLGPEDPVPGQRLAPIFRVLRGGGWASEPVFARSAARLGDRPNSRLATVGFRIARGVE